MRIEHPGSRTLFTELRDALLRIGTFPTDAGWMALALSTRLEEVFDFVPARERADDLRRDVAAILDELDDLGEMGREDRADYLVTRLSLRWRFDLHTHAYRVPEEPEK
ncbi:MAG TPA: hypothetical protein VF234_02955 [Limnochordia bacterium]